MNLDSRFSSALHLLLHIAADGAPMTSDALARRTGTHPVVVRRTLAGLRETGIVRAEKGRGGGWSLARELSTVTLRDVHLSLGSPPLFAVGLRSREPGCRVERAVNAALDGARAEAEALLLERLSAIPLSSLHLPDPGHSPAQHADCAEQSGEFDVQHQAIF